MLPCVLSVQMLIISNALVITAPLYKDCLSLASRVDVALYNQGSGFKYC